MMKLRTAMLTFACIGLLSTASFGEGGGPGTTDPMGQTGTGSSGMGSQTPSGSGMGSDSPGMGSSGMGSESPGMGSQSLSIQGEITRVQDELYIVKDSTGKEVALHVDQSTQKTGELKEGDRIKAEVTSDGHAISVEKDDGSLLQ